MTFGFPAVIAFSALLGMYCGAIYAGSITAILVGTPGTAAAAATMLEGPKFTARGESLKALEMTTIASFIGGIFSCIVLATVAPQLAHFALDFSAPEYFSLGIFGLTIVATLSEGALLKGCIAALLGMLISMIGMDPLSGNLRMTFDSPDLINGVSLVPALVGLYALSQVLVTIEDVFMGRKLSTAEISRKGISLPDLWANRAALIRGSLFGTFIGIVPATGSGTASFAAYSETKRHSKHPELFGKGTLEGIAATESANNAVTGGALIPLLTLAELNRITYQKLLNDYAVSHERQTTMDFHHQLKGAVLDAVDEGLVERDPTRKAIIKGKSPRAKKQKYLNQFELHRLLNDLDLGPEVSWDWLILLIAKTGLRFSEAVALTPDDFEFSRQVVSVNKTRDYKTGTGFVPTKNRSSVRKVQLDWQLVIQFSELTKRLPHDAPIFVEGKVYNSTANSVLERHCKRAGVPVISVHGLRHTHASLLLFAGVSIASVAKRLGHASMNTTQKTYLHIIQELENQDVDLVMRSISSLI